MPHAVGRQMIGKRKGTPYPKASPANEPEDQEEESGEAMPDPRESPEDAHNDEMKDVVTCPECGTDINCLTGKAINDDGSEPDKEALAEAVSDSLDESDSVYTVPGPFGSSADASRGADSRSRQMGTLGSLKKG